MKNTYKTKGVCATQIDFELDGDIIRNVEFAKGCDGNLKAIASLVEGMDAHDAVTKLKGISCGSRSTSCSDQLAKALEAALEK